MVTEYVPAVPSQATVDVPEFPSITPDALKEQATPPDGEAEATRATVPVNPPWLPRVMVETAGDPAFATASAGLAAKLKSSTENATDTVWTSVPLLPVTVTL